MCLIFHLQKLNSMQLQANSFLKVPLRPKVLNTFMCFSGFDTESLSESRWKGGETEALAHLERHLERKAHVATFGRPKMTPQSLMASQTGVSPYLRFGCLSPRLFYYQLDGLYRKMKNAVPPLSLHGQVLWREFFYCAATKNSNFDRMLGNPICVQIPWDKNPKALAKWANVMPMNFIVLHSHSHNSCKKIPIKS